MKTLSISHTNIEQLPFALNRGEKPLEYFTSTESVSDTFCNVPKAVLDKGDTYHLSTCSRICGNNVCMKVVSLLDNEGL